MMKDLENICVDGFAHDYEYLLERLSMALRCIGSEPAFD